MPSVVIIINVAGQAPGVPGESRLFDFSVLSPTPPLVTLELQVTTGVNNYFWEFLDVPKGSTAVFDDPTAAEPTFTPDAGLTSTYLIQCTVNNGDSRGRVAIAFATQRLDVRKLAAGEGPQFDEHKGWVEAYNDFVDKVEGIIIGGNVIGPNPSTVRAIATYGNTTGDLLLDNLLRIHTGLGGPAPGTLVYRAIQAYLDGSWRNLVDMQHIPMGSEAGGPEVILGSAYLKSSIIAIDDPKARGAGGVGKIIHEALNSTWEIPQRGGIISKQTLTSRVFYMGSTGTNSGRVDVYVGSISPNGAISASPGSTYFRVAGTSSAIYQHRGSGTTNSDWIEVVGGSGGDFSGPSSSTQDAVVIFADTTGKVGANSKVKYVGSASENGFQILEPSGGSPAWRKAIRLRQIPPGSFPGGDSFDVGDLENNLILSSLTDPFVSLFGSATGKVIHEAITAGWRIRSNGTIETPDGDTTPPLVTRSLGTNGGSTKAFVGDRDPNGFVTGSPGDTYTRINGTSSRKYQHRGVASNNTDWKDISAVGGTSLGETWTFSTALSGDPGSKNYRFNNATQASATVLAVSDIAENGVNFSSVLLKLSVGDSIYIQQGDDSARYSLVTVTGPPTDNTSYVSIPITVNSYGSPFQNGKTCPSRYMFSGASSGTGTTANRGFYAYRSGSNQTLPPSGAGYVVGLNAKRDDTGNNFTESAGSNLFTAPVSGRYVFSASIKITINHVSGGFARIYLLSSAHGIVSESNVYVNVGGKTCIPSLSAALYMDAGETLQLWAFQDSVDNAVLESENSHFSGAQIVAV